MAIKNRSISDKLVILYLWLQGIDSSKKFHAIAVFVVELKRLENIMVVLTKNLKHCRHQHFFLLKALRA